MSILRKLWDGLSRLKNILGNLLFLLLLIFVLITIFSGPDISVPDSAALVLNPSGIIVDQKVAIDPLQEFLAGDQDDPETLLKDVLDAIKEAKKDERIKVLVLDLDQFRGASLSKLQEIASAITNFKSSGKKVLAFSSGYSQSQYYLAVHADEVYINKQSFDTFGGVFLTGFGVYPTYFKGALDKLKVKLHVFKAGTYKGAVEPFMRNDMSLEAKEDAGQWLNVLWAHYRDTVIDRRKLTRAVFDRYTNHYDSVLLEADKSPAKLALNTGLIDDLMDQKTWTEKLQQLTAVDGKGYASIGFEDYLLVTRPPIATVNPSSDKIAVIVAKGTILDGEQPRGQIGGDSISRLIRKAREDNSVKAIVVRVDSPGGSASASELIRSELEMAQNEGKPVVISMSGYAASGGYWIASTANKIFASPTTITGSIGTFMVFPTFEESLATVGIYSDGIGTTELSNALNPFKNINVVLKNTLTHLVSHTYQKFIGLVARGRKMKEEDVDKIAQGRVWAGTTAVKLGLVDALGDVKDAIDSAALLAGVSKFDVLYMEKEESTREKLMRELLVSSIKVASWLKIDSLLNTEQTFVSGVTVSGVTVPAVTRSTINKMGLNKMEQLSSDLATLVRMSQSTNIYLQCFVCRRYQ